MTPHTRLADQFANQRWTKRIGNSVRAGREWKHPGSYRIAT
jgi:hypothetical protein